MASLDDIEREKLIYSDEIGWIDENHAQGTDAINLKAQMEGENVSRDLFNQFPSLMTTPLFKTHFVVEYKQKMANFGYTAAKTAKWLVKRGLNSEDKKSIALAIMLDMTMHFETLQSNWFYGGILMNDSGFSGEDIISNLLGFYKIYEPRNYKPLLKIASKDKAIRIWEHYGSIGNFKNRELRPWIFPDPLVYPNSKPYKKDLPYFLKTIKPINLRLNNGKVEPFSPAQYIHSYHLSRFNPFR
ncbi:hypothetical protein [Providencia sp. Me31A]|uniref:hypothetical protein n=1 Tax=Providencia sp. Me31A TaxID=3392637 RepID=UPI003D2DEDB8